METEPVKPNRYVVLPPTGGEVAWSAPFDPTGLPNDCRYFSDVFRQLDDLAGGNGLTVYLTWSTSYLPSCDERTVVFLLGDEWCRFPAYSDKVLAVFKVFGTRPTHLSTVPFRLDALTISSVLQRVRVAAKRVDGLPAKARWLAKGGHRPVIKTLPVGSGHTLDCDYIPWDSRSIDIAFLGSVAHGNSGLRNRLPLKSPKQLARGQMMDGLKEVARRRPELTIAAEALGGFHAAMASDAESYSRTLADTRIALVPRGTNVETFRFYEAHRAGCVIVADRMPDNGIYTESSFVTVDRWADLPVIIEKLLPPVTGGSSDTSGRAHGRLLHEMTRERWQTGLHGDVVGRRAATTVVTALSGLRPN